MGTFNFQQTEKSAQLTTSTAFAAAVVQGRSLSDQVIKAAI